MGHRLFGLLFGFVVAVALMRLLAASGDSSPSVLGEASGALATVEIHFTQESSSVTWPTLSAFFDRIADDVEVVAACGSFADEREIRKRWRWPNPLQTVIVDGAITGWSKDRFLVTQGSPARLLCPAEETDAAALRMDDPKVPIALARAVPMRYEAKLTDLVFDAGDILCSDDRAFSSDVLWQKNGRRVDLSERVARLTGKSPFWLKDAPDHHLGMFMAPLQDRTVIVGDPDLVPQDAVVQLGEPDMREAVLRPFRKAIEQLTRSGYKVVRTPLFVFEPKVYLTYTNGIFEQRDGRRIVYMPVYGIPTLDEAAAKAYRSVGWEVQPVPVRGVYRNRGTIGCLVNVLARS